MAKDSIQICEDNPCYWEYEGEPVLLLGASDNDCLFQWFGDRLTDHLDDLESVGGNYVRNTMSIRTDGAVHPFAELEGESQHEDGDEDDVPTYDLDEWNDEYWRRLDTFLEETRGRDIVVELTLWDQHDFGSGLWETLPWNPENNINYDEDTGIIGRDQFYGAIEDGVEEVIQYQERFIDKLLEISLPYENVIYNINNESTVPYKVDNPKVYDSAWERHWAQFIRDRADERGVHVDVANMMMQPHHSVAAVAKNPELYSYVEISQLNQDSQGKGGQAHWDSLQEYRAIVDALGPRPLNNVKVYGAVNPNPSAGSASEAVERFWRLIFGGAASARFHRPGTYGLGLVDRTKSSIRSMRMLTSDIDIFLMQPANYLVPYCGDNEAYCAAKPGEQYAVYFPDGGEVSLNLGVTPERVHLRWLDIDHSAWHSEDVIEDRDHEWIDLEAPGDGNWAVAIHLD